MPDVAFVLVQLLALGVRFDEDVPAFAGFREHPAAAEGLTIGIRFDVTASRPRIKPVRIDPPRRPAFAASRRRVRKCSNGAISTR